jgi:hypothetical protein
MNHSLPQEPQVFINAIEHYTGRLIDSHKILPHQKITDYYIRDLARKYKGLNLSVFFVRTIKSPRYTGPTHRYYVFPDGNRTYMVKETISRRPKRSARP